MLGDTGTYLFSRLMALDAGAVGGTFKLSISLSFLKATCRECDRQIAFGILGATIGGTAALGPCSGVVGLVCSKTVTGAHPMEG